MCGITAIVCDGAEEARNCCQRATEIVAHRGPDDAGVVLFGNESSPSSGKSPVNAVALGHRRLAIIDTSSDGHQPMCTPDQRYWIVYNGEVYNYRELRQQLAAEGVEFRSQSDTEVVLAAFAHWGASCLSRFNGMFAFVVYDTVEQTLFGGRDRFAIKPLYYWEMPDGGLAIGSEIKQFTALPGWRSTLNHQRAFDYLAWGYSDHTSDTFFSAAHQVKGGHYFEFHLGDHQFEIRQWYCLPKRAYSGSYEQATAACRHLLAESVGLRLRADVEVGSCLSGGLDSSSIVCLVNQHLARLGTQDLQKTFTACAKVDKVDERRYAEAVASACRVEGHYLYPEADGLIDELDDLLWHQEEPFGSTSIYAQWCIFQAVKRAGVKVMLDGQGADEQLGGYHGFFGHHCVDLLKELRWLALGHELRSIHRLHGLSATGRGIVKQLLPPALRAYLRRKLPGMSDTCRFVDTERYGISVGHPFDNWLDGSFDGQRRQQIALTNLPTLLRYEDRNSMAHSVEARTPFLDYRLVEFLMSLPGEYLIRDGMTKAVLRDAMRGTLPESIRTRVDKIGFATPEETWMKKSPDQFIKLVETAVEASDGFMSPAAVDYTLTVLEGRRPFTFLVWRILCLGRWMQRFAVVADTASVVDATAPR